VKKHKKGKKVSRKFINVYDLKKKNRNEHIVFRFKFMLNINT